MKRLRIGFGVTVIVGLLAWSFILRSEVAASPQPFDRHAFSGCAAASNLAETDLNQVKHAVVFQDKAEKLQQQGWKFSSYCCNPKFADANGQCSVYLVHL